MNTLSFQLMLCPNEMLRHSSLQPLMRLQYLLPWSCPQERRERNDICLPVPFLLLVLCWMLTPQEANPLYIWVTSPNHQQLLGKLYSMLHSRAFSPVQKRQMTRKKVPINQLKDKKEKGQGILRRQTKFMLNAVIIQGNLYVWVCLSAHYSIPLVCLSTAVTLSLF